MVTTQERIIDGHTWAVTQLPPTRSLKLMARLLKIVGPALGQGLSAGADLDKADISAFGPAIEKLLLQLDGDTLDAVVKESLATARIDGQEALVGFEVTFHGRLVELLKGVAFALEVNYSDFFGGLVGELRSRMGPSASKASITSRGPSGES